MSLYRRTPDVQPAARPSGSSAENADAGSRLTENVLSASGFKPTTADHHKAVESFKEALTGQASALPPTELPPLEVTSKVSPVGDATGLDASQLTGADITGQMNDLMHSVMEVAMRLSDPLGFINAICQFLITLFINVSAEFAQALPQIDLYNQAAQAALDAEKLTTFAPE